MARTADSMRNHFFLTAALEGLELQKQRIEEQIREVRSLLGKTPGRRGRPPGSLKRGSLNSNSNKVAARSAGGSAKRAPLSPAARKRIAAAQKRRWAEYRKSAGKSE
jgi:hypothetical protein